MTAEGKITQIARTKSLFSTHSETYEPTPEQWAEAARLAKIIHPPTDPKCAIALGKITQKFNEDYDAERINL